jgi:hypothetical protein
LLARDVWLIAVGIFGKIRRRQPAELRSGTLGDDIYVAGRHQTLSECWTENVL